MNGQIQDDDEESKENHEGRRKEKRDLKIPRKRKKVKMMVSDLLERVEEKDQTRKDKEFCIEQFLEELEREKREKLQQHQRLSEVEEEKENLSIEIRNLVRVLNERDQNLSLANEELEKKSASVSRLQNDLRRLQSESQNLQAVRDMSEQQLSAKEVDFRALQANLDKEQQARQRLEEELLQSKRTCAELERGLENERSFSQSNQQAAQTKEETRKEQMRQLEQERELKLGLEERVRGLQAEVDEGRVRKRLHVRKEERPLTKQKKKASPADSVVEQAERHVSSNSQDKRLVLHVSTVKIGDLVGKATAPVKVDAEEISIKMETNEGNSCKNISYQFRIPCKDLSECKVNFDAPPFVLVLKPTTAGLSSILGKCKEKGKFLDPESQDANKKYIVLILDYKVMRRVVKADLTELFQSHLAGPLKWIELSSKQAQECLDMNEETRIAEEEPSTQSPKPPSLANKDQRKILTPIKGRNLNTGKKLFVEENKSSPSDASSSIAATDNEPSRTEQPKLTKQTGALGSTIVTQSRRSKSPDVVDSNTEEPVPNCVETVKLDSLRHHKEMESHITLLDQHSKEQRENLQQHQRLLREVEEKKERNLGRIRDLEGILNEKDQALTLANEELEKERASVSRLQNEIEKEREANLLLPVLRSDLKGLQSELQDTQAARNMLEQQFSEKESNFRANLGEEQQARQRLEEELLQSRRNCTELARSLEKERLLSQSNQKAAQTKEETIREQMRQLEQERGLKLGLQETVRGLQAEVEEERTRRVSTERELLEERNILQQNRENLERERETYEQRIRESERRLIDSERRLGELQSAVSVAQEALAEYRRLEPRDWIIRRDEVIKSETVLGTGAWGNVYQGSFRGCRVAVKQIHEIILSPHNRRLFEREMSIASRCRHPNLLQFMGATNDDGNALFVTELLDTDLRKVLSQRPLHHEEIVCLALDVAIALNYLHLNKPFPIIHRDISSSNVLLWRRDDRWRAKLSDYGAANFMRQCMTSNPGARIYAAPEALTSEQSPKVDVYSFGVLLCEMCIRELPDPQRIQEQIGLVRDAVLYELVRQCVMRAPDARPTMNDVLTVLKQQAETLNEQGLVTLNGRTATL